MTETNKSPIDHPTPGPDVYHGLDALCAAMGVAVGFVGLATLIVAAGGQGDASLRSGAAMIAVAAGLLLAGLVSNLRRIGRCGH